MWGHSEVLEGSDFQPKGSGFEPQKATLRILLNPHLFHNIILAKVHWESLWIKASAHITEVSSILHWHLDLEVRGKASVPPPPHLRC